MFPTWTPAKGNVFRVAAWVVGYGGGSLLAPIVFADMLEKTYYEIGAAVVCYRPLVYCFLPESCGRTSEAMDFLLASKSPFAWKEEIEFSIPLQSQVATEKMAYTTYFEKSAPV